MRFLHDLKTASQLGQTIGMRLRSKKGLLQLRHRRFTPSSALVTAIDPYGVRPVKGEKYRRATDPCLLLTAAVLARRPWQKFLGWRMTPWGLGAIARYSRLSESGSNHEPNVAVTLDFADKPVRLFVCVRGATSRPNTTVFSIGSFRYVHSVDGFSD